MAEAGAGVSAFFSARERGDKLQEMHAAALIDGRRADSRTIARENFAQIAQRATFSRPRRPHFEHATSSIDSRSAISPSVTAPLLLGAATGRSDCQ
jgi:hypothetical protein